MERNMSSTTLREMKSAAPARPGDNAVSVGLTDGPSFALAQRIGSMLAQSNLVPQRYQGNVGNCVIALNMAARIGADPLMVMQNLYVVHGAPSWSAQFVIACFNKCGRFSALRYEFRGQEGTDAWGCRAWAIEKGTGEKLHGTWITIDLAKKEQWFGKPGSKWQTMPQQMLMYRAAAWFVRAYAPEIAMGLHTADELRDGAIDVTPEPEIPIQKPLTVADLRRRGTEEEPPQASQTTVPPQNTEASSATLHLCPDDPDAMVSSEVCENCADLPSCNSPHPGVKRPAKRPAEK